MSRYTDKLYRNKAIRILYAMEHTVSEISEIIKSDVGTIKRYLRKIGLLVNKKRKKVSQNKKIRNSKTYKDWRKAILRRDKHTCTFCGCHDRLELDHIEPVSKRPDLIMEDTNARVLCNPCHKTTDSYPVDLRSIK